MQSKRGYTLFLSKFNDPATGLKKGNHPGTILSGNFSFIIRELGIVRIV